MIYGSQVKGFRRALTTRGGVYMDVYPSGHPVMHTPGGVGGLRPTRYDISGFGYDIRDVVRVLNLTIRRKNAKSYDVDCPFCNHKTGKLNINIEKNVFRCNYCDAHGGMLDLYSRLYNVTKTEANQQIREALNLGQYRDDYQRAARPDPGKLYLNRRPGQSL